ncbi:MAG: class I SAM-dependent methyltransferase [Oscillatoria sp. SIO1A7]|nr:class I SAM-dependent methyltransferase [Oscillatoria sp. SIO1A7]
MTATVATSPGLASRLINRVLAVKPLADFIKGQARQKIINRAEKIGVPWRQESETLRNCVGDAELARVENPELTYPDYYRVSFHAYETGNLSWLAASEVEVAARAVHAPIWPDAGVRGDAKLRQSYHDVIADVVAPSSPEAPKDILDIGCAVGMSTFTMQELYPEAQLTGLDLSPYFLAIAQYRSEQRNININWVHAAAEATALPDASFDLVSICLVCHELPQAASRQIFREARRLLRPKGHLAIMDMNPQSELFAKMPAYVLTLLKSTEPYLDQYFSLDIESALTEAGFETEATVKNSPRHRTVIARAC